MNRKHTALSLLCATAALLGTAGCSDWDDHYDQTSMQVSGVENISVYNGSVSAYINSSNELTKMAALLERNKIYDETYDDGQYTFIVCPDNSFDESRIENELTFAKHCVANMAVNPAKLVDGANIQTRSGKSVWVYDGGRKLEDYTITKVVKADNGFIYFVDGILPVMPSAYEYLQSLGDEYSRFKELVNAYNFTYFDREHSKPIGVTDDGRVIYDSLIVTKNTLMDRYDEKGTATWNMRSESYSTTMFIPSNTLIEKAIQNAMDSIPVWLNREATDADKAKFEEWIVKACFADKKLLTEQVSPSAPDFKCVEGYQQIIDLTTDQTKYTNLEGAWWRPAVQKVDLTKAVRLSNGMAYFCTEFKIPNHVVIYRVKSRFYELWNNMTAAQQNQYFRWTNWVDPIIINDCQGQFDLITSGNNTEWPTIFYHNLCAIPSKTALEEGLPCSVEYDGLTWSEEKQELNECHLPAGEYYLRMGFKHSLLYSLSIAFNDNWLVKDMNMVATGANFHFDRGAASPVPHYGDEFGIAYPEGFDVDYWQTQNEKAIAYDTDGYTVGVVNMPYSGNFRIKVTSNDMSKYYQAALDSGIVLNRDKSNTYQLMMYHWCLRPTHNNY